MHQNLALPPWGREDLLFPSTYIAVQGFPWDVVGLDSWGCCKLENENTGVLRVFVRFAAVVLLCFARG